MTVVPLFADDDGFRDPAQCAQCGFYEFECECAAAEAPNPLADFPGVISFSEIKATTARWVWFPYIPGGLITVLGGKGGRGKGLICAALAAAVACKGVWPDGTPAERGAVLWCEAEDPKDTVVKPRLIAAGADPDRHVYTVMGVEAFEELDLPRFIRELNIRVIVLSPLNSFVKVENIINEIEVRRVLGKLQSAIEGTDCAVVGIMHLNNKSDLDALERLLGSVAFANFVRSVLLVETERGSLAAVANTLVESDAPPKKLFRMVHAKHNLSQQGCDQLYEPRYVGNHPQGRDQYVRVGWHAARENVDVDDLYRRRPKKEESAADWLVRFLREHGESPADDVFVAGAGAGYSEDALIKARQRLALSTRKSEFDGGWLWSVA